MAGARHIRIDLGAVAWLLLAAVLALGCGVAVAAAPRAALDVAAIAVAAGVVVRYPLAALIVILAARTALPNHDLIGFLTLGAGAVALGLAAPRLPAKQVAVPFLGLLLIAIASVPLLPSADEGPTPPPLTLPWLGTEIAGAPSDELLAWMNLASVLTVFCLAAWTITTRARLQTLVAVMLVSAVVPIGIGLKQLAAGETVTRAGSALESLRGPFDHPNYYAFYLVVILIVALVGVLETRSLPLRAAQTALCAAALVCLFLTYTRSAWIGFALALAVLALMRYRRLLILALATALLAVLIAPTAATKAQQRFGDLTSRSEANSSNSWRWRVDQWNATFPYGLDRPLSGQGFGSYSRVTVRRFGSFDSRFPTVEDPSRGVFSPVGFSAHNDYVKMFVEMGVPGLALWIFVFAGAVRTSAQARSVPGLEPLGTGLLALTLALMLISVSDNVQGYSVVLMYAFAVCGALAGVTAAERTPALRLAGGPQEGRGAPRAERLSADALRATPVEPVPPTAKETATSSRGENAIRRGRARVAGLLGRHRPR